MCIRDRHLCVFDQGGSEKSKISSISTNTAGLDVYKRQLLFRQGGVEGVGKKKSIAVEGSAAGTEGAQRGGLGGKGMAGAPLGAGTGGIALVTVTDTVSTKAECQLNGFCARQREPLGGKAAK